MSAYGLSIVNVAVVASDGTVTDRRQVMVSVAVFVVPLRVEEIVAVVFDVTAVVLTVNVAEVLPARIVKVAGTVAAD